LRLVRVDDVDARPPCVQLSVPVVDGASLYGFSSLCANAIRWSASPPVKKPSSAKTLRFGRREGEENRGVRRESNKERERKIDVVCVREGGCI
jgi:hypothetical protein